jgi:hypothetical protein
MTELDALNYLKRQQAWTLDRSAHEWKLDIWRRLGAPGEAATKRTYSYTAERGDNTGIAIIALVRLARHDGGAR